MCVCVCAGEDVWDIEDPRTWSDPEGDAKQAPMVETANMYLQVKEMDDKEEAKEPMTE